MTTRSVRSRATTTLVPAPGLVVLALVPLALAAASLADASMVWSMVVVDAAIMVIAAIDAVAATRHRVEVQREAPTIMSILRKSPVIVRIRSQGSGHLLIRINEDVVAEAEVTGLPARARLQPGQWESVEYAVTPTRRGALRLGDHFVRHRSPLGLWDRQLRIPAVDAVKVYPDIARLRVYERLVGQDRGNSVVSTRHRRGGESEFEQLRRYAPGDAYRCVDWKATARRGHLVSRQYQLERDQSLLLMLDSGRLMTALTDELPVFDHALNAALMLAHIVLRGGDRVGMLAFDQDVRGYVPPTAGTAAMQHIIASCYHLEARLVASDFNRGLSWLARRQRNRNLVVLFTQLQDSAAAQDLISAVCSLKPRHLPLVVLFQDVDVQSLALAPGRRPIDHYNAGAAAELLLWRDGIIRQLEQAGVLVLDVSPGELTPRLINAYLDIKARHLL